MRVLDGGTNIILIICFIRTICAKNAIIISGGYSNDPKTSKTVEVWSPDGVHCHLPDLDIDQRYLHTQDGLQACGGGHSSIGWHTCTSLTRGRWVTSHNFTFSERWGHTSWHTSRGTYLMGGGIFAQESVLVQAGGLANYSFHMKNNTNYACSMNAGDSVVITGGYHHLWYHGVTAAVVRYSHAGWVADLATMITPRYSHACATFVNSEDRRVFLVTGGFTGHGSHRLFSTEILLDGHHHWQQVGDLPIYVSGMRATSLDNTVFALGGYDDPDHNTYLDQILQYDASNQSWARVGTMFECRAYHAVSVIDMDQLAKYCK